jgi:hypothetical protein
MRPKALIVVLFSLLTGLTFSAGCERETVDVKERKVEYKRDIDGDRKIETKERKVITDEDGRSREIQTKEETKIDNN